MSDCRTSIGDVGEQEPTSTLRPGCLRPRGSELATERLRPAQPSSCDTATPGPADRREQGSVRRGAEPQRRMATSPCVAPVPAQQPLGRRYAPLRLNGQSDDRRRDCWVVTDGAITQPGLARCRRSSVAGTRSAIRLAPARPGRAGARPSFEEQLGVGEARAHGPFHRARGIKVGQGRLVEDHRVVVPNRTLRRPLRMPT